MYFMVPVPVWYRYGTAKVDLCPNNNSHDAIVLILDPNYANWTETGSCVSDNATATLLLGATNQLGSRKSLETTDYGFIDGPVRRLLSYQRGTSNRGTLSLPLSLSWLNKFRDYSSSMF